MKSHLRLVSTNDMSDDAWMIYRKDYLGASEIGAILGLSPYRSSIEVFYNKIGEYPNNLIENINMLLGTEQEPFIKKLWTFWEKDIETMILNYRAGKIVRNAKRINAYIHNPKFPWLTVSLDFEINKTATHGNGALECKTINGWAAGRYKAGFPPEYVIQIQTQLLVCEYSFGEAAILQDNSEFFVLPFKTHKGIQQSIIHTTKEFWDRVVKARIIMNRRFEAQRTFNYRLVDECNAEIQSLEPPPDGTLAYSDFLKKKYNIAAPGERMGTDQQLMDAIQHLKTGDKIKKLEETKRLYENRLKNVLKDGADKLTFGDNGFVSWKADVNNVRKFVNKINGKM